VSALVNLGYSAKSAKDAVDRANSGTEDTTLEALIKKALRVLV
jgi:Holliday junction resolvasome RuvABC DNA-binding subunit